MEIIKKKICLEDFISRIPALIETVDTGKGGNNLQKVRGVKYLIT